MTDTLSIHPDESVDQVRHVFARLALNQNFPENYPPGDLRNTYRASLVVPALVAYCERSGGLDSEPVQTVISDVLSDLMHLVDRLKDEDSDGFEVTFTSLVDKAERRYLEEVAGE